MPRLNLNYDAFQQQLFALERDELLAVIKTFKKLRQLLWQEVYKDKGLNWELAREEKGERFYSIRVIKKFRALVQREGDFVVFMSLHPDHDSAYQN